MTLLAVLTMMTALAPRAPEARTRPLAEAILRATDDRDEAVELATLAFVETTFGAAGVPFGLSCCARPEWSLGRAAVHALAILRRGAAECGPALERRMHWYRTGHCGADNEAERRARIVRRLLRAGR